MSESQKDLKKELKRNLRGVGSATVESLVKKLSALPYDRMLLITDVGFALATTNLRTAVEMLKAAPDVSRFIDASDVRVWAEVGKRLSATSAESAASFFQSSAAILEELPEATRSPVLRLINKQAALSANTAIESFKSSPGIIDSISCAASVEQILTICLELARH